MLYGFSACHNWYYCSLTVAGGLHNYDAAGGRDQLKKTLIKPPQPSWTINNLWRIVFPNGLPDSFSMEVIMDMVDILTWHRNQSNVFSNELFKIFFLSSLEKVSIGALMKRIGTISTLRSSVTQVRPPGFDTRELAGHSRSYGLLWKAWTNDPGVRVSSKFHPSELFVDLHIIGPTPDRASAISRIYQHQPEKRRRKP